MHNVTQLWTNFLLSISVYVTIGVCLFFFLMSMPYCASGGFYLLLVMDDCLLGNNFLSILLLELILVAWIFGQDKFTNCITEMGMDLKKEIIHYLMISLRFICPLCIVIVFFVNIAEMGSDFSTHYTKFTFLAKTLNETDIPDHLICHLQNATCTYIMEEIEPLKWMAQIFTIFFTFLFGGIAVCTNVKSGESWRTLFKPTPQ